MYRIFYLDGEYGLNMFCPVDGLAVEDAIKILPENVEYKVVYIEMDKPTGKTPLKKDE